MRRFKTETGRADMDKKALIKGLRDFGQSASNTVADTVAVPVDMIAAGLRYGGLPIPSDPMGGSQWMRNQGLTAEVAPGMAKTAGEAAGMIVPMVAAAKAPQIASGLLQAGRNLAKPSTMNKQSGAIVWHGSPHKFDKFDSSKIGTGEGAQAYGHGLYLAENPAVAREYQEKLSSVGGAKNLASQYGDVDKGITEAQRRISHYKQLIADGGGGDLRRANGMLNIAQKNLDDLTAMKAGLPENTGALYKVDLPDEHIAKMLDWDKPLSQQSAEVQKALNVQNSERYQQIQNELMDMMRNGGMDTPGWNALTSESMAIRQASGGFSPLNTGEDFYKGASATYGGHGGVSGYLKDRGIPGIRYLDGGSRGAGQGSSNFVVFPGNESLLQILERNGKGLAK